MIDVSIQADRVVFEVKELDQLWSLQTRLEIPIAHIQAAHVDTNPAMGWFQGFKLTGTDIPNIFRAGTFYQDGGLVFWDVSRPDYTIVVDLAHERYQKLVIEVADPTATVALINAAVS
jgi:hypothetical protein